MLDSYKNLIVWQKAIELVFEIYSLTSKFPKEETYSLTSQMRRAAVAIPSNIAEGSRRKDLPEYLQFLRISDASSAELETQLIISKKLYSDQDYSKADNLLEEIQKMLNVLLKKLEEKRDSLKPKTQNLKPDPQSGIAVVIAVLFIGVLTSIVLALSLIFLPKIRLAGEIKRSSAALYAAESGLEWCLYVNRYGNVALPAMSNGATYVNAATNVLPATGDCVPPASSIKIIGTYQGISRAFEISGF